MVPTRPLPLEMGKPGKVPGDALLLMPAQRSGHGEPEVPGQSGQHSKAWPGWLALEVHRPLSKAPTFSFHWW